MNPITHYERSLLTDYAGDDGTEQKLNVLFSYHANDPYAVTLKFPDGDGNDEIWTMARDLLIVGRRRKVGEGSVIVRPYYIDEAERVVEITCRADGLGGTISVGFRSLGMFLMGTSRVCKAGKESELFDFDEHFGYLYQVMGESA